MHQQPMIRSGRAGASFHAAANRPRDCHCGGIRRFMRQLDPDRRGETSTVTILSSRTSPMGRGRSPISTGRNRASKARLDCCREVACLSGRSADALRESPRGAMFTDAEATGCTWPAFLTTWRGEVRERAVRTRRKPGGGKRREPLGARNMACKVFHESRNKAFTVHRPSDISSGANQAPAHGFHESRVTKHESRLLWFSRNTRHETRITAFFRVLRPSGGEKCRLVLPAGVLTGSCFLARSRAPGF